MDNDDLISELKCQSTWRLVFLSLITLGVYPAYYIRRQTRIINPHFSQAAQISNGLIKAILILSYLVMIFTILELIPSGSLSKTITILADGFITILGYLCIVWGVEARKSINTFYDLKPEHKYWFNAFWSIFISVFYINWKTNAIAKDAQQYHGGVAGSLVDHQEALAE